ncbi:2Fe-2S iron-sulfur cluster-binding protein [Algibacillus agarilyticus]|uniref:2Fe-2S iron-sulfur cluster-binding protein n=1 Tax=Algibacillus agarilyticus TaxID=2234133 RepID=UPI000DD0AFBD|nr:2Fe-2S iron-sulfur cluster-binding protein [Algibacillus agarilyticus]
MAHQYAQIAFTQSVRQVQEEQNSRSGYASMDTGEDYNYLISQEESNFIQARDSFYMASVSETDWPYVQHRGGPKGFLKVIDERTIGFADYKGNRQYVSTGNFRTNDKVSLILMDYPNRRRLKIVGHITLVDEADWETLASLEDDHYRARVERGFIIKIAAFDWNCPQHITPRYNELEVSALIEPLENQIKQLKNNALKHLQPVQTALGNGELPLVISGVRQLTPDIRAYELRGVEGQALPKISAGSHIQVPVELSDGELAWRNYSISSNPNRTDCYEIAVKREDNGRGGSVALHQQYYLGLTLHCKSPQNMFSLEDNNQHSVLIAGGIGITPIKSMALALLEKHKSFEVHYAGRSKKDMAYTDRLVKQLEDKLHLYPSQEGMKLSIKALIENFSEQKKQSTHFYFCGPESMLTDLVKVTQELGIEKESVHYEQFSINVEQSAEKCELTLTQSGVNIEVESNQTLLEAVLAAGVQVPFSCKTGQCKSCVVQATPSENIQHRDNCLTSQERASGKMCLCVSRPNADKLTIDL